MTVIIHKCECGTTTVVNKNQKKIDEQRDKQGTFMGNMNETVEWFETTIEPKDCKGCGKRLNL